MISKITLNNVLPQVFGGSENDAPVKSSKVWLQKLNFSSPNSYLVEAESGTGKTSLCSFIYGYRRDYNGEILFDDENIKAFTIERWSELRTHSIAFLPQELRLFPELTVWENIQIKNRLTDFKSEADIKAMLQRLEIEEKLNEQVAYLSIGQQQRVAIVRALCQPFDFLLLDEPVSHLDARNNSVVAQLITEEASSQNASIIATSVGNNLDMSFTYTLNL